MKKLLALFTFFIAITASFADFNPGENLLINGEFNGNTHDPVTGMVNNAPDFWGVSESVDKVSFFLGDAPAGKGYIRISETAPDKRGREVHVKQPALTLVPGEKYRFSALIRTKDFESGHHGIVAYDRGWYHDIGMYHFPKNQDWTRVTQDVTMIESKGNLFTFAIFACNFKGTLDVADVRLEPLTEKAQKESKSSATAEMIGQVMLIPWQPLLNKIPIPPNGQTFPRMRFLFSGKLETGTEAKDYDLRYAINDQPEVSQPLDGKFNSIAFPKDVKPGEFLLKLRIVNRATGKVVCEQKHEAAFVNYFRPNKKNHKRLNNLVVELLNTPIQKSADAQSFSFDTLRDGWVFITAKDTKADALEITLDGKLTVLKADTPRLETFRDVSFGSHTLTVKGASNGGTLIVRSIPEILNYKPCCDSMLPENPKYDWAMQEKYVHPSITTHNDGVIPEKERASFFERGYRWIGSVGTSSVTADVLVERLNKCAGMNAPQYQGVTCDEQGFGNLNSTLPFATGLKKYVQKNDHIIYTWIVGRPALPGLDSDFISTCLNASHGRGRLITEVYCGTKPTLQEARDYLNEVVVNSATSYKQYFPHVEDSWGFIFGNFIQVPVISLAHHPHVDYKYYLDMQMNLLANNPACLDLGITGYWGTRHCDFEMFRWCFMLTRHYCIEGKKNMLSDEYGFSYAPGHIGNGDFADGMALWTAKGNVTTGKKSGYSNSSQNRWGGNNGAGDTFAILTKKEAEVSSVTQTANKLRPGKTYCLQFAVVDYNDLMAKKFNPRRVGIDVTLDDGAEIDKAQSWVHVDKREYGQYSFNHKVPKCNLHHIVFKAQKPQMTFTIHNTAAAKGEAAAINYVSLNPFLDEK